MPGAVAVVARNSPAQEVLATGKTFKVEVPVNGKQIQREILITSDDTVRRDVLVEQIQKCAIKIPAGYRLLAPETGTAAWGQNQEFRQELYGKPAVWTVQIHAPLFGVVPLVTLDGVYYYKDRLGGYGTIMNFPPSYHLRVAFERDDAPKNLLRRWCKLVQARL